LEDYGSFAKAPINHLKRIIYVLRKIFRFHVFVLFILPAELCYTDKLNTPTFHALIQNI